MVRMIVGGDPHKRSVTSEAIDEQGEVSATGRFGTQNRDYHSMVRYVRQQWPHHRWAVEGARGVGRPLAQRLLADGETVVDVPAKLSARVRMLGLLHGLVTSELACRDGELGGCRCAQALPSGVPR
jgi:hypothetical protein